MKKGQLPHTKAVLEANIQEDLKWINQLQPDWVIGDFRISLSISARITQTPLVSLSNLTWSPFSMKTLKAPDHPITNLFPLKTADSIFKVGQKQFLKIPLKPINQARRKYGLSKYKDIFEAYTDGDHVLFFDPVKIFKTGLLPPHQHVVGHLEPNIDFALPEWLKKVPTNFPKIYINLGSSGDQKHLKKIMDELSGSSYQLIISTSQSIQSKHKNIWIDHELPSEKILDQVDLFIGNGGTSSSYSALNRKIPVIGIPSNLDQIITMSNISNKNMGKMLRPKVLAARGIKGVISACLTCSKMRASLESHVQSKKEFNIFLIEKLLQSSPRFSGKKLSGNRRNHL